MMEQTIQKTPVKILKPYKELFNPKWRNIVYYGGRSSGKSHAVAQALLLRGRQQKLRILCTREVQNTIRDSVHKLLGDLIEQYGFNDYEVQRDAIYNRATGTEFLFRGLKHNINEIKSTEGIDICWVEEGQSITDRSLDILTPTIRKQGSQIIITFNRFNELDPVYVRFVMNKTDSTYVKKVNYDTLERAGLLPDVMKLEKEADRNNPALFAHKWLGEPLSQSDKSILDRTSILEAMQRQIEPDGAIIVGVDVARMGDDRTVFWKRQGLKTLDYKVFTKLRTPEVCDQLERFIDFDNSVEIKVDDTGVGCITYDTKILTVKGWVRADKLKVGDSIYSKNLDGSVVVEKLESINARTTQIINCSGYKFSWSHQVPYRTRLNNATKLKGWQEVLLNKQVIFESDFDYESSGQDFELPKHIIDMPNGGIKTIKNKQVIDRKLLAEYIGWYVSEGSFEKKQNCLRITQNKNQYFDRIVELTSLFGEPQIKKNGRGFDICVFNKPLYDWVKQNCYKGGYGFRYKTVPRFIANNDRVTIDKFLSAFNCGDGYEHYGSRYYTTSSKWLVEDLIELIYKIGKKAGYYINHKKGSEGSIDGRITQRTQNNWVVFEAKYNRSGYHYGLKPKNTILSSGKVYSLILSGDSRLMFTLAPNTKPIWTHNGGVTDELLKRGYEVKAINFGGAAHDSDKYPNWISEAWFGIADNINQIELPMDSDLLMELSTRGWYQDTKGKRRVESKNEYKKRGFRSPDLADACIICYATANVISLDDIYM